MQHTRNLTVLASSCLLACTLGAMAQVTVEWDKTFGGGWLDGLSDAIPTAGWRLFISWGISISDRRRQSEDIKGSSDGDYWIVKIDDSGQKQWDKTIGGELSDGVTSVVPAARSRKLLPAWLGTSILLYPDDKTAENKGEERLDYFAGRNRVAMVKYSGIKPWAASITRFPAVPLPQRMEATCWWEGLTRMYPAIKAMTVRGGLITGSVEDRCRGEQTLG